MAGLAAPVAPEGQSQLGLGLDASEWGHAEEVDEEEVGEEEEEAGEAAAEEEARAAELTLATELGASPPRPLPPAAAAAAAAAATAAARGASMAAWLHLEPSGLHVRSDAPAEVLGLGFGSGL